MFLFFLKMKLQNFTNFYLLNLILSKLDIKHYYINSVNGVSNPQKTTDAYNRVFPQIDRSGNAVRNVLDLKIVFHNI